MKKYKADPLSSTWKKSKKNGLLLQNPMDPLGYDDNEIKEICKKRKIQYKKFNEAFAICAGGIIAEDGKPRYYRCDVEKTLYFMKG
jgi:hypothetical protein